MTTNAPVYKVTYGGWYQRTTLHLSEVYDLFAHGTSTLKQLSPEKLKDLQAKLHLTDMERVSGFLESVQAHTASEIEIRYYEDGMYVLEKTTDNVPSTRAELEAYYEESFSPAISYIFSLGAPTPKVLANIKTVHPTVISVIDAAKDFEPDETVFGEVYTKITSGDITVYKTPHYIFIADTTKKGAPLETLVEMQIFFREFKDQLEKYLGIHRTIWEEISKIKEGEVVRGSEVEDIRGRLDGYQKSISLITNRINQMGTYVSTRSSLAKHLEIEGDMITLFEYKFETLSDTLAYIKEIWKMTTDYLGSAIQNLVEIKNQATSNNLKSLQTITSIGVISGVLGYLSSKALPQISTEGVIYFVILFALTWILNYGIVRMYKSKKYSLSFGNRASDI